MERTEVSRNQLVNKAFPPLCACGCGNSVFWNTKKWNWSKYLCGHNNKNRKKVYRMKSGEYFWLFKPDHPYCNKAGYVQEHRFILEQKLGRQLKPEEIAHHKDKNTFNNHPDNLELFSSGSEHARYHHFIEQKPRNRRDENGRFYCR